MKKTLLPFLLIICLLLPTVLADGGIVIYDKDMWGMFDEEQQFCAINYKDGTQHMILTVDTGEELRGEKAVWIFPVPAEPEKTKINILKAFPRLFGYDIAERAEKSISGTFNLMRITQVYTFPLLARYGMMGGTFAKGLGEGVTIHKTVEKMGLTTELISAKDSSSFSNYLISKDLNMPAKFRSILSEYIGEDYCFVISWISDIEKFKLQQKYLEREGNLIGNSLGVYLSFPTDKIYYPLKPTSVYGDKEVPAVIYVMDHVVPELYPKIEGDTEVQYFFQGNAAVQKELKDFFAGYDQAYTSAEKYINIGNLKYTKIKISPKSKYLTKDLWMKVSTPSKVSMADFANRFKFWYGLLFFIISSCLASLIAGMVLFKEDDIPKSKFLLLGLFNFSTLIGFSIASYKMLPTTEDLQEEQSIGKVLTKSVLVSLVIAVFLSLIFAGYNFSLNKNVLSTLGYFLLAMTFMIWVFLSIILTPFIWGYYKNRKTMKFVSAFTIIFMILTFIFQYLLYGFV